MGQSAYHTQSEARYAEHSTSGWTSSLEPPEIEYLGAEQPFNQFGYTLCTFCIDVPDETPNYIDRLLVHMPDGSSHELRKSDMPVLGSGLGLGGIYYAVDGSRLKFDANTATLYMPDGSCYLLAAPGGVQFIDHNGNTLSYNSANKQWTDTLGRAISLPPLQNSAPGDFQYSLPGVGGASRMITFRYRYLSDVRTDPSQPLRYKGDKSCPGYPETTLSPSLFGSVPILDSVCWGGPPFNPVVLWQIVLSNNSDYTFTYNIYGEIDKVVLPTGGYQRFRYEAVDGLSYLAQPYKQANRGVVEHWISAKGDGSDEVRWQYEGLGSLTRVIGPNGAKSERVLHTGVVEQRFGFDDVRAGRAKEERTYAAGGQMIRRTLVDWTMDVTQLPTPPNITVTRNPRSTKKVEILLDTGGNALASTTTTSYDADLNVIATNRYDYVPVDPTTAQTGDINSFPLGTLLRAEESTFLVNDPNIPQSTRDAYRARHLISLPSYARVTNGATIIAETQFKYDEAAYPLLTYGVTPTGWTNPGVNERGNMTTTRRWLNISGSTAQTYPNGSFIETHAQYDQCGNPRKVWDSNGKVTETFYVDSFSDGVNRNTFAYATSVTTPTPDPTGAFGSNQPFTSSKVFEFNTGKVVTTTDANNKTTSYFYTDDGGALDSLQRLRRVTLPDGLGETKYEYGDAPSDLYIRTLTKQNATTWLESRTNFDGLGRPWRNGHYEGSNSWSVKTAEYDALGHVKRATNPYFAANLSDATPGNAAWTTTTYDDLNRVLTVTTPDGATVETTYSGNQVTVKDQANKKRRSITDALGRLARVVEDPDGVAYQTDYSYDTLGNLTDVNQGGQRRYFFYDSLGRLKRAKNPEQSANSLLNLTNPPAYNNNWSLAYSYDANGNLVSKTDASNITTTYGYDALNRNTTVTYSDSTPGITRAYDTATLGKGRLQKTETAGSMASRVTINEYDAMGRPKSQSQQFFYLGAWGTSYTTQQTYDLASNVKTLTYPSLHTVTSNYDQAGRLSSFSGNLGGSPSTYADTIGYNAAGQMIKERFGTNTSLYHNSHYNNRLQLVDTRLGDSATDEWSWNRGAISFLYGSTAVANGDMFANDTDNNGNLRRQINYVPLAGGGNVIPQQDDYTYDALNRIATIRERQRNVSGQWAESASQAFSYDRWGNRTLDLSGGGDAEAVWMDDAVPTGAVTGNDGGDSWNWVSSSPAPQSGSVSHISNIADQSNWSPAPYSGNLSHQSNISSGFHQHLYHSSPTPIPVRQGGNLYAYIYIDPQNIPQEVMLQWGTYTDGWEHRAYWGANIIGYGTDGTASRNYMGPLPAAGGWVRLNVPASAAGLEGMTVGAMAFTLYGGRANWDLAGIEGVDDWGDYENYVLVDDSIPAGAVAEGTDGDGWYWSGGNNIDLLHQHYFYNASDTLQVSAGDKLFAWVYLDSAYTPSEVMLQWCSNENGWGHRAYWGTNNIPWGTDGTTDRKYIGPLPAAGGWVKLEIPASAVGLEGKTVNGMAFTLYGGRAAWDKAGKVRPGPLAGAGPPINNSIYTVDAATNRLTSVNGVAMSYDAAGNQTNEGSGQRIYDGENRLVEAKNSAGMTVSRYVYDADGRRVRRIIGGQETWQVYGIGGELLAEYAAGGASNTPQKEYGYRGGQMLVVWDGSETGDRQLQWLVQDHLGSTRMVVDRSGSLGGVRRHDFAPFGGELIAGAAIRSEGNGYSGDSVRQKFGSYERDNETELDFAQSRYYGSVQGRFTSPDSFFGRKTNPQTLNLYAYVLNNPLKWADPTGHFAQNPKKIDDCHCTIDRIDSEHPGEIEGKRPGFFSRIWGGLKKIGSAIGGTAKEMGSQAARDFIGETKADFRNPSRILDDFNYTMSGMGPNPAELFGAIGALGAGAGEIGESATVVEDVVAESDVILYHGTDLASAESILAGEGLSASRAAALKLEVNSSPGFFLATHAEDAAYFATRRGTGAILEFRFSPSAVEALGGLPTSPLGALGKFGRFLGGETAIPVKSFEKFNAIRVSGGITVRPH